MTTEFHISRAEIAWKSGRVKAAIRSAKRALDICNSGEQRVALSVFLARAYAKIGDYSESNSIYRKLIDEKNYLPPVIMGLLYNSLASTPLSEKVRRNLGLMKLWSH